MAISLPLRLLWWPLSLIPGEWDLFIFRDDFYQKLKYYGLDSQFYLTRIIDHLIILILAKKFCGRVFYLLVTVYLAFCILELAEYYALHWKFPMEYVIWPLLGGTIAVLARYGKIRHIKGNSSFFLSRRPDSTKDGSGNRKTL